jgi:LAGLIDADG endonuclease
VASAWRANHLTVDAAAYIAGLIDGEGTITLTGLHRHENRRLVVSISSTELPLLQFVVESFGAGKITRKKTYSDRHSPSFCYAVTSRQALSLLQQVLPYLRSHKRARAELSLERYESLTPRNGKYTVDMNLKRREFEHELLSLRPTCGDRGRRAA